MGTGQRRFLSIAAVATAAACGDGPTSAVPEPEPEPEPRACVPGATVDLKAGEATLLPAGDSVCFALAAGGRYAVAFFDSAGVSLEARNLPPFHAEDAFSASARHFGPPAPAPIAGAPATGASVAGRPAPPPVSGTVRGRSVLPARGGGHPHPVVARGPADCAPPRADVWCRTTPWEEGDRFQFHSDGELRAAEVVAVVEGMVLAFWADEVEAMAPQLPFFRALAAESSRSIVGFLRERVADIVMETAPGSGQVVVLAREDNVSLAYSQEVEGGSLGLIALGLRPGPDDETRRALYLRTMAHELGHLWQFHHFLGLGGNHLPAHRWAIEGGADLVAREYLRIRFDLPLESETDVERWGTGFLGDPQDAYWYGLHLSRGQLERGYFHAEPFLRDLLVRLVRAGVPADEALAELVHGSMEGWVGHPGAAFEGAGLTARMARALGTADPVGMVLTWTLANALDDRTPSDVYQNRTVARAWREEGISGWPPVATLAPGQEATATARVGSTGYFVVQSPGGGDHPVLVTHTTGAYGPSLGPNGPERARTAVRWMVARID